MEKLSVMRTSTKYLKSKLKETLLRIRTSYIVLISATKAVSAFLASPKNMEDFGL